MLGLMEEFQLKSVKPKENRGTSFITESITRQDRTRSYVANGYPDWLFEFFCKVGPSVVVIEHGTRCALHLFKQLWVCILVVVDDR